MCDGAGQPVSVGDALSMLDRALGYLTAADVASLPAAVQAEALRVLGRAEAKHTAARVLGAFAVQGGCEDDGHGTARTWLKWQTRVTTGAAAAAEILAGAARGGADLAGLAGLAREMFERCCRDGSIDPPEEGFEDRWFRLGITFRGAGRAEGDLSPGCAAALAAVLEALGKKAGPEDTRTGAQRRHDALEEAW